MSFGGDYGKDTGDYVNAAKDAIATMVAALPEITINDEEDEFDFILEEDHEWDIYESGDMADECDLEYALRKWIEEEGEKPNPVVLKRIQAACAEIGGEK